MATFEDLRDLLGEPRFRWTDPRPWEDLEERIGCRFPEDFKRFSNEYGPVLINNQVDIGHPGVEFANLGTHVMETVEAWQDAPEGEVPYPVGVAPGELLPWGGSSSGESMFFRVPSVDSSEWTVGVYEHDEGTYHDYAMTFNEWMLAYLKGEDVTVCSRNFAPEGPFYRQNS
jgi:hypothetical protein